MPWTIHRTTSCLWHTCAQSLRWRATPGTGNRRLQATPGREGGRCIREQGGAESEFRQAPEHNPRQSWELMSTIGRLLGTLPDRFSLMNHHQIRQQQAPRSRCLLATPERWQRPDCEEDTGASSPQATTTKKPVTQVDDVSPELCVMVQNGGKANTGSVSCAQILCHEGAR